MSQLNSIFEPNPTYDKEHHIPVPELRPNVTFLSDTSLSHTVPALETSLATASLNVIHYDVFAGLGMNFIDPMRFLWPAEHVGVGRHIDADDAALFPPDVTQELLKDSRYQNIHLPQIKDISSAKRQLAELSQSFVLSHDNNNPEEEQNRLQLVQPRYLTDASSETYKTEALQSAFNNQMNFLYTPLYTEDSLQTWKNKKPYQNVTKDQATIQFDETSTRGVDIPMNIDVNDSQAVQAYIEDSFAAMNETPIHPSQTTTCTVTQTIPFFLQLPEQVLQSTPPPHASAEAVIRSDNAQLLLISGSSVGLTTDHYLVSETTPGPRLGTTLEGYSMYLPKKQDDEYFVPQNQVLDEQSQALVREHDPILSQKIFVWDSLVDKQRETAFEYQNGILVSYDKDKQECNATFLLHSVSLQPWSRNSVTEAVSELPHVITVNHPDYIQGVELALIAEATGNTVQTNDDEDIDDIDDEQSNHIVRHGLTAMDSDSD